MASAALRQQPDGRTRQHDRHSADRVVLWTGGNIGDLTSGGSQRGDTPLEIYMEGDIVFREGDRVIFAQAMYYNVARRNGVILNAELLTPVPNYAGLMRLRSMSSARSMKPTSSPKAPR